MDRETEQQTMGLNNPKATNASSDLGHIETKGVPEVSGTDRFVSNTQKICILELIESLAFRK